VPPFVRNMGLVTEPSSSSADSGYLLDNRASDAGQRFDSLSTLFNPVTFRHLEMLGIARGWRCWEVGVGGPSIPQWLSSRVGPSGHVLATDIDVTWTQQAAGGNVEVRRHDVAADDPPKRVFDLVHARLVLIHVPQREQALERMVGVLGPGGWLLIEDFDPAMQPLACVDVVGPEQRLANKVREGFRALLAQRGADLEFGRRLPRLLREAGLVEVAADAFIPLALIAGSELERANMNQVRDDLIAGGHVTAEEIDEHLLAVEAGRIDVTTPPLISAWGRRP
jgi:Methylase of chemotaxis methyl-accepting proteins